MSQRRKNVASSGVSKNLRRFVSAEIRRRENGREIRLPADPPAIVTNPFYPLTVIMRHKLVNTTIWSIRDKHITAAVQAQLGIATTPSDASLMVKIHKARVWYDSTGIEDTTSNPSTLFPALKMLAYGLLSDGRALKVVQDTPGAIGYPRVGYEWPEAHKQSIMRPGDGVDEHIIDVHIDDPPTATATRFLVAYFDVQWSIATQNIVNPTFIGRTASSSYDFLEEGSD